MVPTEETTHLSPQMHTSFVSEEQPHLCHTVVIFEMPRLSLAQSRCFHCTLETSFHLTVNVKTHSYSFMMSVYNFEVEFTCLSAFIVNNLHQKCCIMKLRSGNCYLSKQNQSHIISDFLPCEAWWVWARSW